MHHDDLVRVLDGGEAVGDHDGGAVALFGGDGGCLVMVVVVVGDGSGR